MEAGPGLSDPFGRGEIDIAYLEYLWAEYICIPFCNRDLGVKQHEKEGKGIFLVASISRMGRSWFCNGCGLDAKYQIRDWEEFWGTGCAFFHLPPPLFLPLGPARPPDQL